MKTTFVAGAMCALIGLTGCNSGSPGGPGATKPESEKHFYDVGTPDNAFSLSVPTLGASIKQGETRAITISVKRGKNFDENVELQFADMPKGLSVDPATPAIKHGETEAKIMIKAADAAALGSFTAKVTGHPEKGKDATNDLKIKVEKK